MSKSATDLLHLGMARRKFFLSLPALIGAEGPAGAEAPTADPLTEPVVDPVATPTDPEPVMPPPADGKTYTQAEVDKFVEESKKYRKRAQDAEKKLSEHEKAQMTEKERAEAMAKEEKERADKAVAELAKLRVERAIEAEATSQKFTNPSDVIAFLDLASLKLDDDGKPDTNSLKAAVKRVADAKPYLIQGASQPGSADGGARGGHKVDDATKYQQEYQGRGMVPINS